VKDVAVGTWSNGCARARLQPLAQKAWAPASTKSHYLRKQILVTPLNLHYSSCRSQIRHPAQSCILHPANALLSVHTPAIPTKQSCSPPQSLQPPANPHCTSTRAPLSQHLTPTMSAELDIDFTRRNKKPRPLSEHEKEKLDEFVDAIHYSARWVVYCKRSARPHN
jgi:hypothetical protein